MTHITPTVGRKVWYFPAGNEGRGIPDQPLDATVCYVNAADETVNLACHDQIGQSFTALAVPLITPQQLVETPDYHNRVKAYATWMPYQQNQADRHAKQTQLEATNGLTSIADATAAAASAVTEAPPQAPTEAPAETKAPVTTAAPAAPAPKP